jgi:hypothetical protein
MAQVEEPRFKKKKSILVEMDDQIIELNESH